MQNSFIASEYMQLMLKSQINFSIKSSINRIVMSINEHLLSIYREKWTSLSKNLEDISDYSNPLLIYFYEEKFKSADIRVMIFGQETKGWISKDNLLNTPKEVSNIYQNFFCLEKFYKGYGRSSFWKAFRFFQNEIKMAHPNKNIYFSWNNINKIGRAEGTGINSNVEKVEREFFSVITSEVKLFKPDIVIFMTGPSRDSRIKFHFEDAEFISVDSAIKTRALAKVKSQFLPENTIRIYHPSYFGGFNKLRRLAISLITK